MEYTKANKTDVQKTKGLHSAFAQFNADMVFVGETIKALICPLKKFKKEGLKMGLFGGFGPGGDRNDCCELILILFLLSSCGCGCNINLDCNTIIMLLLFSTLCGTDKHMCNPCR